MGRALRVGSAVREELAPGQSTADLVLRSTLGYTGEQPRMQILQHKEFVDAKVELYPEEGLAGLGQARRVPDRAPAADARSCDPL